MRTTSKEIAIKMKVFPKGQVVIPISLRKRYNIDIGDHIDVIPGSNGILLKPSPKVQAKNPITKQLFGMFGKYAEQKPILDKTDIDKSTEAEFVKGWIK
ncbi:MAG: AbrB/MazE/SpoVT family DNA-binding domain-containing protein [Bacteroidota bacterium]|nr:AbrB/MazE/SpoVT family DNA-binding domain-containing protein [Bacteroidota bacterium]